MEYICIVDYLQDTLKVKKEDMRKIRLFGIVFVLALTFTACSTSESLDQLIDETAIETVESTDDEEEGEETQSGSSSTKP